MRADDQLPGLELEGTGATDDGALEQVCRSLLSADPEGLRAAKVFRYTFDQLYDGQRTGRYRWEQLFKTEKTHFGTLIEINLRREFNDVIDDGSKLDFKIAGKEIDCKYAHSPGGWMLPPESFGELLLVCSASDLKSHWSMGVVRARDEYRRPGKNRDNKTGLNETGRRNVRWLHHQRSLPPNVLLLLPSQVVDRIFAPTSGQQRVNELFRSATGHRIHRNTIATVARQDDYMKRVRMNGGARSCLAAEGIVILGGDYRVQTELAAALGLPVPQHGEFVSARIVPCAIGEAASVSVSDRAWRVAKPTEHTSAVPDLPRLVLQQRSEGRP